MLSLTRNMLYCRVYLFCGRPGTGKTSLSVAIEGDFGLDLHEVKIPSAGTDADLAQGFHGIPRPCVVLLKKIDAVRCGVSAQVWTAVAENRCYFQP